MTTKNCNEILIQRKNERKGRLPFQLDFNDNVKPNWGNDNSQQKLRWNFFFFFCFFRVEKNKMRGQQNYKEILIQRTNENEERTYSLSIRFQWYWNSFSDPPLELQNNEYLLKQVKEMLRIKNKDKSANSQIRI